MLSDMKKVRVNYLLPEPLAISLKRLANHSGKTATEIVRDACERYLAEERRAQVFAKQLKSAPF